MNSSTVILCCMCLIASNFLLLWHKVPRDMPTMKMPLYRSVFLPLPLKEIKNIHIAFTVMILTHLLNNSSIVIYSSKLYVYKLCCLPLLLRGIQIINFINTAISYYL